MAQRPIPDMDYKSRFNLTKDLIGRLNLPKSPPEGFKPLEASDATLISHGLPPRPNKTTHPAHYSKWEKALGRSITYVAPTFKIMESDRIPLSSKIVQGAGNSTSPNWSGGVVTNPPIGETYNTVSASWVVPNAYPPASAWNGTAWKDGTYLCVTWVGIDGWGNGDVLQAGTGQEVVVSGGKVTSQNAFAWHEWYPALWVVFSNFEVNPGDTIACLVCAVSNTQGSVVMTNRATGKYTSIGIPAPNSTTKLQGSCAEWIMEDPSMASGPEFPMPDYGVCFFYDCLAGTKTAERNVSNATLINLVEGSTTLSTAVAESPSVLMTYAGSSGP
jgi:Peptidase A4 family